jgi:hypothetical protein
LGLWALLSKLFQNHLGGIYIFRYEMSNCLFEATLQTVETKCGCVPKYFQHTVPSVPVCNGESKKCMNKLNNLMGDTRTIWDKGEKYVSI